MVIFLDLFLLSGEEASCLHVEKTLTQEYLCFVLSVSFVPHLDHPISGHFPGKSSIGSHYDKDIEQILGSTVAKDHSAEKRELKQHWSNEAKNEAIASIQAVDGLVDCKDSIASALLVET